MVDIRVGAIESTEGGRRPVEHTSGRGVPVELFVSVFRQHPAGVTVVTLDDRGCPVGFTATSVVSVCAEPPLLSFSISTKSSCWSAVQRTPTCVVNLLASDQHGTARRFAARGVDRFETPTRWGRLSTGEPVLTGAAAWLRCQLGEMVAAGDHRVVIAHVVDARIDRQGSPLLYHDGEYSTLGARLAPSCARPGI
jgi:flavin reductase (DIM6/NTAB) family NADH-FMN oxidoreductase RutF